MKLKLKKLFVIKEKKRNNHNIYERNIPFHFLFLNILLKKKKRTQLNKTKKKIFIG